MLVAATEFAPVGRPEVELAPEEWQEHPFDWHTAKELAYESGHDYPAQAAYDAQSIRELSSFYPERELKKIARQQGGMSRERFEAATVLLARTFGALATADEVTVEQISAPASYEAARTACKVYSQGG